MSKIVSEMASDLLVIFQTYLILIGLQLLAWPWLYHYGKDLVDRGWAAGRTIVTLTVSLSIWFLAYLKFPVNNELGVTLVIVALISITWWAQKKSIRPALEELVKIWWVIVAEEILFLLGYVVYALVRGYQPEILGLEKFMDYGFIKSYLSSPTLPAKDMWFAGSSINYYSFGHFWTSIMTRLFGTSAEIAYNLMLAFILGTSLSLVFAIVANLLNEEKIAKSKIFFGGLLAAILVVLGGNSHTIWSLISKGTLAGYWYADATRFIYNTIHEFPSYSFVVSDLHGHVLGLPIVLTFLLFLVAWNKTPRRYLEIAMGCLLGMMVMTNTWDGLIYGLLLAIYGLLTVIARKRKLGELVRSGFAMGGSAVATALPWLIGFKSISNGVAAVTLRSPLWQLLVLWAGHLLITVTALILAIRKDKRNYLILALGLTAITLLLIPEFIYVKDIYPNHPRANTMFKLTYQALIMMGILYGYVVGGLVNLKIRWVRVFGMALGLLLFACLVIFPFVSFKAYYNHFANYKGLDGFSFLKERYPTDLELIGYLAKNRGGKNLIEAVGDSYTENDFISAFSGIPTVVGWRVHEWLWRGGYDVVGKRDEEVRRFYEEGTLSEAKDLIKKYSLGWVVVTSREREKYKNLNERKLKVLGRIVWTNGASYLIAID